MSSYHGGNVDLVEFTADRFAQDGDIGQYHCCTEVEECRQPVISKVLGTHRLKNVPQNEKWPL